VRPYAESHYAECCLGKVSHLFIVMPKVVMQNVVMLSVAAPHFLHIMFSPFAD
jgi:hypothetical protein